MLNIGEGERQVKHDWKRTHTRWRAEPILRRLRSNLQLNSTSDNNAAVLVDRWRCSSQQPFLTTLLMTFQPANWTSFLHRPNSCQPLTMLLPRAHSCMTAEPVTTNLLSSDDQSARRPTLRANVDVSPVKQGLNKPGHWSSSLCNRCLQRFDHLQSRLWSARQPCSRLTASDGDVYPTNSTLVHQLHTA